MKRASFSQKHSAILVTSAFLGGWSAHGIYAKTAQVSVGSIEAKLVNAPVVIAETAMDFAKSVSDWAVVLADRAIDVINLLRVFF